MRTIVVALVAGAISAVGFWLSPLRDVVAHWIWKEQAALLLTTDSRHVVEGDPVQLHITVTPKTPVPVAEGVIELSYDATLLKLRSGSRAMKTSAVSSTLLVPAEGAIEFLALAPGITKIGAALRTRYGTYSSDAKVEIWPSDVTEQASLNNFTGKWQLQVGTGRGYMEIRQKALSTKISGSYFLDNGDTGVIEGWRDGKSFWASFTRGNSTTRWYADEVPFRLTEGYIEIKGDLYLEQATQNGWVRSETKTPTYATIAVR